MMDSGGPETEEDEIQDLAQFVQQKPQSPMKVVVGRYTALLRELNSLREDESITIVHYLTEWTEQRTGSVRTRNELETVLANHKNIAKYIKGITLSLFLKNCTYELSHASLPVCE